MGWILGLGTEVPVGPAITQGPWPWRSGHRAVIHCLEDAQFFGEESWGVE